MWGNERKGNELKGNERKCKETKGNHRIPKEIKGMKGNKENATKWKWK